MNLNFVYIVFSIFYIQRITEGEITYDWLNRNLYWTDSKFQWIIIHPAYALEKNMYKAVVDRNLTMPYGITVDPNKGLLFWSDIANNPVIERSNLAGNDRKAIVTRSLRFPNSLVADETTESLFWTDQTRDTIETCSYSGVNRRSLTRLSSTQFTSLALFKTNTVSMGYAVWTTGPCEDANGGCQEICVASHSGRICQCSLGFTLQSDQTSCSSRFAFADRLTIDYSTNNIYFSQISRLGLSGSIRVVRDRASPKTIVQRLNSPRAVALYPSKGYLFFTDHEIASSHISRCYMDGSTDRLYWTDGYHNKIESTDLNGANRREILVDSGSHMVAIVLGGAYIYYTAWSKHKTNCHKRKLYTWLLSGFKAWKTTKSYIDLNKRHMNSLCSSQNGQCSTYCLPTASGRTCSCEDGVTLNSDGRTCQGAVTCNLTIPNGNFTTDCYGSLNNYCQYNCDAGYQKNPSHSNILCSMPGVWNPSTDQLCLRKQCSSSIPNGAISTCNRYVDDVCSYQCNSGYRKNTSISSLTCLVNAVTCNLTIPNGNFTTDCYGSLNNYCQYNCDAGYQKNPSHRKQCSSSIPNGAISTCNRYVDDVCSYQCNSGYRKNTSISSLTCLVNAVTCNLTIPNGNFTTDCYGSLNNYCQYNCDAGYQKNPSHRKQCSSSIPNGAISTCNRYVDDVCSYQCNSGYRKNTSISSLTCLVNAVTCNLTIPNGNFTTDCYGSLNNYCQYNCDAGYQKNPSHRKQCSSSIPNGAISTCNRYVDEVCSYQCNSGYRKNTSISSLTCLVNGDWDMQVETICEGTVTCNLTIPNGNFTTDCYGSLNNYCQYNCDAGYQKNPSHRKQCSSSIPNGAISTCNRYVDDVCSYQCNSGYRKNTSISSLTCLVNGDWDVQVETICEEIKCLKNIPNGTLKICPANIGSSCNFDCDNGFQKKSGVSSIFCLATGLWSEAIDELCVRISCQTEIPNVKLDDNCSGYPNSVCQYSCTNGFLKNPQTTSIHCLPNGVWSPHQNEWCKVPNCNTKIQNGQIDQSCLGSTLEKCNYSCNTGYTKNPAIKDVTCNSNNQWSKSADELCKEVKALPITGIVGGAGGSFGLIVIIVIVLVAVCKRKPKKNNPYSEMFENSQCDQHNRPSSQVEYAEIDDVHNQRVSTYDMPYDYLETNPKLVADVPVTIASKFTEQDRCDASQFGKRISNQYQNSAFLEDTVNSEYETPSKQNKEIDVSDYLKVKKENYEQSDQNNTYFTSTPITHDRPSSSKEKVPPKVPPKPKTTDLSVEFPYQQHTKTPEIEHVYSKLKRKSIQSIFAYKFNLLHSKHDVKKVRDFLLKFEEFVYSFFLTQHSDIKYRPLLNKVV
ncbi:hypothetical protein KUTeg_024597 [Tegillarca granosa]|uniref:Sushi domain-containing protein n=1 Tax=Tegillarca granosa TaxID=220873 RepID=A0ABQ9E0U4_TEGGR|nr:hypothetical protein KUTeg_024597 [Tegillarca granosa]